MPKELIDDELWSLIEPLLPARAPRNRQYAGRKPTPDRAVLTGIVFVLRSGIAWNLLPQEMGCGSGTACWRRLVAWQEAGVWQRIHETLLAELRRRGEIDLSRALADSSSIAPCWREKNRPESHGPAQARQQTPPHRRRARHPARGHPERSEST
jgi:transposase